MNQYTNYTIKQFENELKSQIILMPDILFICVEFKIRKRISVQRTEWSGCVR